MGNAAGSMELPHARQGRSTPAATGPQRPAPGPRLPMPPEEELEERFGAALVSGAQ